LPATEVADVAGAAAQLERSVREAGSLARSMFGKPLKNWTKGVSSPVSDADIAVDELLRARLMDGHGDFGWLSEESIDDPARLKARYVWIVDPIDGTRAYIGGFDDWAVSAALVENGRPIVGCLYAPLTEEFFMAIAGHGATRNGVPVTASPGTELKDNRIAGPKPILEQLQAVAPPFTVMPRTRSLALRLARVGEGTFDVAIAGGNSHDWDLAAADLLVHEAGGALTAFAGSAVIYNQPVPRHGMLIAAGRLRHAALLKLIRDEGLCAA
jgi:myo-inositol-1(or 4)-monophosphatase